MANIGEPVREHEIELEPMVLPVESEPERELKETPSIPQKEKEPVPV